MLNITRALNKTHCDHEGARLNRFTSEISQEILVEQTSVEMSAWVYNAKANMDRQRSARAWSLRYTDTLIKRHFLQGMRGTSGINDWH